MEVHKIRGPELEVTMKRLKRSPYSVQWGDSKQLDCSLHMRRELCVLWMRRRHLGGTRTLVWFVDVVDEKEP